MITINNIYKSYDNVEVLKGVSATINKGEIVSIVGPSGAGKTTLLQILGTLLKPDGGEALMDSVNPFKFKEKNLSKFRNTQIGFVFQFHQLLPEFTALENACIPGFIGKRPKGEVVKYAKQLFAYLNIEHRESHKPNELSGGEQQRVAVARALINKPLVVLADEPSGNLDTKNKEELHNLFFKLRDEFNQTFVIVTHDKELAQMSDRTLNMQDGRFV